MMNLLYRKSSGLLVVFLFVFSNMSAQQISLPRIESMPKMPQPYIMRDWKQVALGYDSLAYDLTLNGEYLPLSATYSSTRNYPEHGSFYQVTYVGQNLTHNEAINSMMGVVGASLCGVDKSNQFEQNWVLMLEEFFNKANGQDLYLNNYSTKTGNDWWYETIPNALFYQLYSIYPDEGHFQEQFITVADRWLEAVYAMGASTSPWSKPYMNYRSFNIENMEPRLDGVPEPEAAGIIAWIFYMAYVESGYEKYRIGAELCMEYFSQLDESPVYELQYLYGLVAAVRMNSELGTDYDIEKMMNWCFDVGPLRVWAHTTGWGVTVGNWNGIDASGLNGAISVPENTTFGDYAFIMNSFQQAGIMAPIVRYDDRYARAMGKYLLNMSNSARLFYSKYLPDENQDCEDWSKANDPNSYIAYEALRRYQDGISPFATGDAMKGGWAPTNLSLYSSSAVGYLGGMLDTTDVSMILKYDLLKNDFFHNEAYPSYLLYNPYEENKTVTLDVGESKIDVYDAVKNTVIMDNVSGPTSFILDADAASVIVYVPAGSAIIKRGNLMICNDIVVDHISSEEIYKPLRIKAVSSTDTVITILDSGTNVFCTAEHSAMEEIHYSWESEGVNIANDTAVITWVSPKESGTYWVKCKASNSLMEEDIDSVRIRVVDYINTDPVIERFRQSKAKVSPGDTVHISCKAVDAESDDLSFSWSCLQGSINELESSNIVWQAPEEEGTYYVVCELEDKYSGKDKDSIAVRVIDQSAYDRGELLAHYPFNGDVNDYSGNSNDAVNHSVGYVNVRDGACYFNGTNGYVEVSSSEVLNCNEEISVSFWLKASELFDRESYPISHGLWHERWKISITENRVRWTVRTVDEGTVFISDLDSETKVEEDQLIYITATYDGAYSDLYINSGFEGFLPQKGLIEDTDIALTVGQASPSATGNNFKGVLDEIKIYDYALSHEDIKEAYEADLLVKKLQEESEIPLIIYPNPFSDELHISYHLDARARVSLEIYDLAGTMIKRLYSGFQDVGNYHFSWNGVGEMGGQVARGIYLCKLLTNRGISISKIIFN